MLLRIGEFLAILSVVMGRLWTNWNSSSTRHPFDVLGTAEVGFAPPAQLGEPHNLREP